MGQINNEALSANVLIEISSICDIFKDPGNADVLSNSISHYIQELQEDMGLSAFALDNIITISECNSEHIAFDYLRVSINGISGRLPVRVVKVFDTDIQLLPITQLAAKGIYLNRGLFISDTVSKSIYKSWLTELGGIPESLADQGNFNKFLLELIERGFHIDRGKQVIAEEKFQSGISDEYFEEAATYLDSISFKVYLGSSQYELVCQSAETIEAKQGQQKLDGLFDYMQECLYEELGVIIPKASAELDNRLKDDEFKIQMNDFRLPSHVGLTADQLLVNAGQEWMTYLNMQGRKIASPVNGSEYNIIESHAGEKERCEENRLTTWGPADFIILVMAVEARRNAGAFFGCEALEYSLNRLKETFPSLVEAAEEQIGLMLLTKIFRSLLDEQISIRDKRSILEAILMVEEGFDINMVNDELVLMPLTTTKCPTMGTELMDQIPVEDYVNYLVMTFNGGPIAAKYVNADSRVYAYFLSNSFIDSIEETTIGDSLHSEIIASIYRHVEDSLSKGQITIIAVPSRIRKKMKSLIRLEFPQIIVLGIQGLEPKLKIESCSTITLNSE